MRTYERFGEAVRVTLGTAAVAGLVCFLLAGGGPRPLAWIFLWVSLVAAASWFYVADRNRWRVGVKIAGQFGMVIVGLAASLSLVVGSGWMLLGGLVLAGLVTALCLWMDDGLGSDLGGPVD
ncbi:hypothetical protein RB614_26420 [Phytohabitans sp. ZYX-F-186]|uniref:Uncharacterized protein n=1 Tax=Phytohabitans maris TaxID=3071409 RepID=A0ABU0ZLZ5_9ACTN|nr:hypothetical protein [Phytohabitans sp. ZYX-F-186]MDQ7908067.1 hypothetical protein [Phytohabitans sp. ZYX-F-186]